jgi:hypothetical protein
VDAAAERESDVPRPSQDGAGPGMDVQVGGEPNGLADALPPPDSGADMATDSTTPDQMPSGPNPCARAPGAIPVRNGRRDFMDLIINAGDFAEHEGQRVHVFTREYSQKTPLGYGSAVVQGGGFMLRLPDGYARFSYQPIFWYVDVNGDGRCDEAAGDHPGYMPTNGWNPSGDEPLMHGLDHRHVATMREERVCDVMNACR